MTEEPRTFSQTRARLEEIVVQVRKKDTSLEKSLDLLEEGVKLANQCTELIDHADWENVSEETGEVDAGAEQTDDQPDALDERAAAGAASSEPDRPTPDGPAEAETD